MLQRLLAQVSLWDLDAIARAQSNHRHRPEPSRIPGGRPLPAALLDGYAPTLRSLARVCGPSRLTGGDFKRLTPVVG